MSLALTSLLALVTIIVISCVFPRVNPGLPAIIAALIMSLALGINFSKMGGIVFALGSHRSHTPAEQEALVGKEIFERYRCVDSDQTDVVRLGITTQGTPVDVSRIVAEADRRICLGNIEYHYFAGYSGGAKAIMPGEQGGGWLATMVLGIVGALVGGFLGGALLGGVAYTDIFSFKGLITSIIGALIVLAVWGFVAKRRS